MKRRSKPTSKVRGRLPMDRALLAPIITSVFEEMHVGAALHTAATTAAFEEWYVLHGGPSVMGFEMAHGTDVRRWRYNARSIARAHQLGKPYLGEHAGFCDFFVPVGAVDGGSATLVVGPFSRKRWDAAAVLGLYRSLTGNNGRLADPAFSHFLSVTLSILVLDASMFRQLERLLSVFTRLLDTKQDVERLSVEVREAREKVASARAAERMWEAARSMLDEHGAETWVAVDQTQGLLRLGLTHLPEHVMVGLFGRADETDAIEIRIRDDYFQRACVEMATREKGFICSRIADHGVALLVESTRGAERRLVELAERTIALARRFGLKIHMGIGAGDRESSHVGRYRSALGAAEQSLAKGLRVVRAEPSRDVGRGTSILGTLRRSLGEAIHESPKMLSARFQSYVEAASVHYGYMLEPLRAEFSAGFDQIADALASTGLLDERDFLELRRAMDQNAAEATTVTELSDAYRRLVADIELTLLRPTQARQERGFRRALVYIREHLGERLTRARVARVAGFQEHYFSKRFKASEGRSFREYVERLRLERAQKLLSSSALSVERVASLSGFHAPVPFHRAFKRIFGMTPAEYRARAR